jgi:hypothetical protein
MPKKYGDDSEPGVISLVGNENSVEVSADSPANPAVVGPADLTNGSATAGKVYVLSQPSEAVSLFGSDSLLTQNVMDAFGEGGKPVWAVPTEPISVTGEEVSANEGQLANAPVSENADDYTFSVGGTELTTRVVHYEPDTEVPGTDEVYVEPSTGKYVIDSGKTPASGDTVEYTYHKYQDALNNVTSDSSAERIDQLTVLTENEDVHSQVEMGLEDMADNHNFAGAYLPVGPNIDDKQNYTPAFDNKRIQVIYPGRNEDGELVAGAYVGMRSRLGIRTTPIKRRLITHDYMIEDLESDERESLIDNRVVPIQSSSRGARVMDDVNTVNPENNQESNNIRFAYTNHVVDYITKTVQTNEERFIGGLHRRAMRRAMKASINSQLRELKSQSQVIDYNVSVEAESSVKAGVDIGLDLADPLRFVENRINVQE